ncbi:MAG: succinate dehydrogenase, hydrophobic membrane anchor protein [Methylococcaceae bacterium]|nr:succinate dehydrogenase, hydrophobic membrane anchor protein [Methylococcaceae bacterium]
MHYRSALARVHGLGSAKSGTSHWWMQRVTAVALIPLSFIIIHFINTCFETNFQQISEWFASPLNSASMIAWIIAVFYHSALGLQVVIEDYVAHEGSKIILIWSCNLFFSFLALLASVAVFRIILIG